MIAKIGRSSQLYGVLAYNNLKVEKGKGIILSGDQMMETVSGRYTVTQLMKTFETLLAANRNTENPAIHISLNPDSKDQLSDDNLKRLAADYLQEMGYGNQPYIVFKHSDIEREHIHIVTVCVDEDGRKISDRFEKRRSMTACRRLEEKYNLHTAQKSTIDDSVSLLFKPLVYEEGNLKKQMASILNHLSQYYNFTTFGEYNALLSLFNIEAEKVYDEKNTVCGLVYHAVDERGMKRGNALKASLFKKVAGLAYLEVYFKKCSAIKSNDISASLSETVLMAMKSTQNEKDFKKNLTHQGINAVVRRNAEGRIYGITFVDHGSKVVWNGSRLNRQLSAAQFEKIWDKEVDYECKEKSDVLEGPGAKNINIPADAVHPLFNFMNASNEEFEFGDFGGLLNFSSEEDPDEERFIHQMKRRRRKKR